MALDDTILGLRRFFMEDPIGNFYTRRFIIKVQGNGGRLLKIDDSDVNCISTSLVARLRIPCIALENPYVYNGVWVTKKPWVCISHRHYKSYVMCDVYPMQHVDVLLGDSWLQDKRVSYSVTRDRYHVGEGLRSYDFEPCRPRNKLSPSTPSCSMQRNREQEPHFVVERVPTRSPTSTRNGGTSARSELTSVNKVNPQPQAPKPSGSPAKKKEETSTCNSFNRNMSQLNAFELQLNAFELG